MTFEINPSIGLVDQGHAAALEALRKSGTRFLLVTDDGQPIMYGAGDIDWCRQAVVLAAECVAASMLKVAVEGLPEDEEAA